MIVFTWEKPVKISLVVRSDAAGTKFLIAATARGLANWTSLRERTATLVFVEVKTRSSARFGRPFDAVTMAKRRKLVAMADDYLARKGWQGRPCRFDVVGLSMRETGRPVVGIVTNAFEAERWS